MAARPDAASPGPRAYSLRRRLTLATLGSSILCALVSLAIVVWVAWDETSEVFDDALEEGARLTLALGASMAQEGLLDDAPSVDEPRKRVRLYYQLISDRGEVVRRAEGAPSRPFVDPDKRDDRYYNVWEDGELWRVYVLEHEDPDFSVQVGQRWEARNELLVETIEALVWPALAIWLLLGLFNWWAIRRLLRPLEQVARGIATKSPQDLGPVPDSGRVKELRPVVQALNQLLARLSGALEAERRFTADAAHELRTPLAALGSKIQLMQRSHAGAVPALDGDLAALRKDVARSTALVENLLVLARLDAHDAPQGSAGYTPQPVKLPELLREAVLACQAQADDRGVRLQVQCDAMTVPGQHPLLFTALRNLIDNAVRYGRQGGQVRVSARREQGGHRHGRVVLEVCDDGPGVAPAELERLTQRFYRVLGNQASGSGLGLSIVARIAALHGAELSLGAGRDGQGLCARLVFEPDAPAR